MSKSSLPDNEFKSDRNFRLKCSLIEANVAYLMLYTVQICLLEKGQSSEFEEVLRMSSEAVNKHARFIKYYQIALQSSVVDYLL